MEKVKRLFDIPYFQLENYPKSDAFSHKVEGKWISYSIQDVIDKANLFSRGLLALGVKPGDKIALISNNRPEWNIADIGILQIGAIDVPIYPTISEADYKYIFNDAGVKFCFVSDEELLNKVNNIAGEVSTLEKVYTFNTIKNASHWTEVLKLGENVDLNEVQKLSKEVKEDDVATLIYTSGTTGTPKGVMLSHKNIASNAIASRERLPVSEIGKALSFLPVCHIYERMILYLYMLTGVSVYFAESLDTVGDNLREIKPNVFTAVPRLLEKVYDKIVAKGSEQTGIKKKLFFWALELGQKYEPYGANGWWYEMQLSIARKLIFSKWREALGGNVEAVASGSAALQPRLARVFLAAGIPIMEGYGLTETSPVVSVNCADNKGLMIGTVGRVLKDVKVKIAEDGEILVKGPNVMLGYYNKPDKTAEVMDEEGWFHTGDIGTFIDNQYLKITDRKKEIFKTSGGKYIAPQVMENKFKESRFIEQLMVIGESQKHPAAIIVPAFAFVRDWCKIHNIPAGTNDELIRNEKVRQRIWEEVEHYNTFYGSWEQIKKIELVANEWGVPTGELTPTLKLKRKFILEKYKDLFENIYGKQE